MHDVCELAMAFYPEGFPPYICIQKDFTEHTGLYACYLLFGGIWPPFHDQYVF
ncbi:MAG: hypothetical protein HXS47_00145 [Theionarchaea archaeon]|nr:hypothetical protein [Theionarchaea archaeon]